MKVKAFMSDDIFEIETEINEFIEEIEKDGMAVKDIKFEYGNNNCHKYVLVIYGPDLVASIMHQAIKGDAND